MITEEEFMKCGIRIEILVSCCIMEEESTQDNT